MKLKTFTSTLFAICLCSIAFAQSNSGRNPNTYEEGRRAQNVYFEAFGPGVTYSFNYDTRFQKTKNGLGGRIGASYVSVDGSSIFTLPVGLNYLLGKNGNYFEMGLGATFLSINGNEDGGDNEIFFYEGEKNSTVIGNMTFGYRRQPVDGGFSFRAGFAPVFGSGSFIPYWPYIGFGYAF